MNFIIKDKDGNEVGPIDQETLEKWIELHKVFPDTPIRNSLMKNWKVAKELDFLEKYFKRQMKQREEKAGFWEKRKIQKEKQQNEVERTAPGSDTSFRFKYLPASASLFQRFLVLAFDAVLLAIMAYILLGIGALTIYSGGNVNSVFTVISLIYAVSVIMYYSVCLGVFAQTFGMWYWGILIVKDDISAVYMFRAYIYTILMFVVGVLTPFFAIAHPKKKALHDILAGTRLIRVAAQPKT